MMLRTKCNTKTWPPSLCILLFWSLTLHWHFWQPPPSTVEFYWVCNKLKSLSLFHITSIYLNIWTKFTLYLLLCLIISNIFYCAFFSSCHFSLIVFLKTGIWFHWLLTVLSFLSFSALIVISCFGLYLSSFTCFWVWLLKKLIYAFKAISFHLSIILVQFPRLYSVNTLLLLFHQRFHLSSKVFVFFFKFVWR